jgi:hypothetical protein
VFDDRATLSSQSLRSDGIIGVLLGILVAVAVPVCFFATFLAFVLGLL